MGNLAADDSDELKDLGLIQEGFDNDAKSSPTALLNEHGQWGLDNGYEDNAWMWNMSDVNVAARDMSVAECIYLNDDERALYCSGRTQEMCDGSKRDWFCDDPSAAMPGETLGQFNNEMPETCYRVVQGTGKFGENDVSTTASCCTWDPDNGST